MPYFIANGVPNYIDPAQAADMGLQTFDTPEAAQSAADMLGKTPFIFNTPSGQTTINATSEEDLRQQLGGLGMGNLVQTGLQSDDPTAWKRGGQFWDNNSIRTNADGSSYVAGFQPGANGMEYNKDIFVPKYVPPEDSGFDKFMFALSSGLPLSIMGAGLWGGLTGANPLGSLDGSISNLFGGGGSPVDASWGVNPQGGNVDFLDYINEMANGSNFAGTPFTPDSGANWLSQITGQSNGATSGFDLANSWESQALQNAGVKAPTGSMAQQLVDAGMPFDTATKLASALGNVPGGASNILKALGGSSSLLGAGLGGLLGGLGANGKPAGSTTSTTVSDFPDWYKPYVMDYLNKANSTYNAQSGYDPALVNAGNAEMLKTVQGQYLDPATNPYLQKTYDMGAQNLTQQYNLATKPGMDAQFNRANAFGVGNSAWQEYDNENKRQLGNSLGNLATNVFGGNYQQERTRQANAAGTAPGFSASAQSAPYAGLSAYGSVLGNFKPQSQTNTQPYFSNQSAGILGGALAGSQFGKLFG